MRPSVSKTRKDSAPDPCRWGSCASGGVAGTGAGLEGAGAGGHWTQVAGIPEDGSAQDLGELSPRGCPWGHT